MSETTISTPFGPISKEQFLEAIHWAHSKTFTMPMAKSNLLSYYTEVGFYVLDKKYEPKIFPISVIIGSGRKSIRTFSIYFLAYIELKFFQGPALA